MARTKAETIQPEEETLTPEVTAVLTQSQNLMSGIQDAAQSEFVTAMMAITRSQVHSGYEELSRTARISEMKKIKETKAYRALKGQKSPNGAEFLRGTWEEYCNLLGRSVDQVDHDIQNLTAFGGDALEAMDKAGLGYRDLRQLRKLPDDEKTALIEVAKAGDKDALVELAETIIEKHSKEKTELTKKLEDVTATLEAKDAVAETNAKRINELQEKVARIKKMPVEESSVEVRNEVSKLQSEIEEQIRVNLHGAFAALCEHEERLGHNHSMEFITAQANMLHAALLGLCGEFGIQLTSNSAVEWENN